MDKPAQEQAAQEALSRMFGDPVVALEKVLSSVSDRTKGHISKPLHVEYSRDEFGERDGGIYIAEAGTDGEHNAIAVMGEDAFASEQEAVATAYLFASAPALQARVRELESLLGYARGFVRWVYFANAEGDSEQRELASFSDQVTARIDAAIHIKENHHARD